MPWQELKFGGLHNSVAVTRVPEGRAWSMQNTTVDNGILELGKRYGLFGQRTAAATGDVGWGLGYGKYAGDEVHSLTLTGIVTGGFVTLRWRPTTADSWQTTGPIQSNTTASGMQVALEGIDHITPGDVLATGGPWPSTIRVQYRRQYANRDVELLELVSNSLEGSSPGLSIREEVKGGTQEEYLAVVQHASGLGLASHAHLYSVNVQTGAYTEVATGLHPSDWYFAQYAQRIWAVNRSDGLNFKTLGGSWNNGVTGDKPVPPNLKPQFSETVANSVMNWASGVTFTVTGLQSFATLFTSGAGIYIRNTGPSLAPGTEVIVDVTYTSTQDFSHRDFYLMTAGTVGSGQTLFALNGARMELITTTEQALVPTYTFWINDSSSIFVEHWTTFANAQRQARAQTKRVRLKVVVSQWRSGEWALLSVTQGHVWESDTLPLNFGTSTQPPTQTRARNEYGYAFWDDSAQQESDMSPTDLTSEIPTQIYGCWNVVTLGGSQQLADSQDRIYIYRKRKADGTWRRLPQDASNPTVYGVPNVQNGSTTFTDKWMEEELRDFPQQESSAFPGTSSGVYADQIGVWKQCLVVGANKQAWISYVGQPQRFAPSPDDSEAPAPEEDDLTRGKTEYVSDNRSEDVYGVHGQDSLYLVTPLSIYSVIGDIPAESTPPRRLPESRGTLGRRSSYRLGGGVLSGAEDGLWRYSVGRGFSGEDNGALIAREETEDARRSWAQTLLAGELSASGMVVVEYLDERWAFCDQRYMVQTRNRHWLEGTLTHTVKAAQSARHLPLRFLDAQGRLHNLGATYQTDAGSGVSWVYTTGILDGPRSRVRSIQLRGSGRPRLSIQVWDGRAQSTTISVQADFQDQSYMHPLRLPPAFRYQFTFEGEAQDTVEYCALEVDAETPPAKGN